MFDKRIHRFLSITALAAVSLIPLTAAGQATPPDTSNWKCQFCPFETGTDANVEAGGSYVNEDAARFGNATGYDEKGGYVNVDGEGSYLGDEFSFDWYAEDLGLDSRVLEVEAGKQGRYGFRLGYREIPERVFDTTATVFTPSGPHALALPSVWVPAV